MIEDNRYVCPSPDDDTRQAAEGSGFAPVTTCRLIRPLPPSNSDSIDLIPKLETSSPAQTLYSPDSKRKLNGPLVLQFTLFAFRFRSSLPDLMSLSLQCRSHISGPLGVSEKLQLQSTLIFNE